MKLLWDTVTTSSIGNIGMLYHFQHATFLVLPVRWQETSVLGLGFGLGSALGLGFGFGFGLGGKTRQ